MARIVQKTSEEPKQTRNTTEAAVGDSSFIQKIKYDASTLQLTVTMKNGAEYIHSHMNSNVADEFMTSPSKGSFYSQAIKGRTPSIKIIDKNIGRILKKER